MTHDFVSEMEWRDLIHQATHDDLRERMRRERLTAYIGFDPTADSLHVGSLLPVMALVRLQRAGHRPIAIVGGGTGLIGDPSGKASERTMLSREDLAANLAGLRRQLERFLDFSGPRGALLLDNADWLCSLGLLEFLRDIGKHFSVNAMIDRDSVQTRLHTREQGISFTEFAYALLQAYDFLHLHQHHGCELQMGGSDQWGNILDGCELIRRKRGAVAFGLTMPLVTRADGQKFGKSEGGNVWLAPERTRPFTFYQYWLNVDDADVVRFLRYFTLLDRERIDELAVEVARAPEHRRAQVVLAEEVTRFVHGPEVLGLVRRATDVLFGDGDPRSLGRDEMATVFAETPRTLLRSDALGTKEASLVAILASGGLFPSRKHAREAIRAGSVTVNHRPVDEVDRLLTRDDLIGDTWIVLRRGRKTHLLVEVAGPEREVVHSPDSADSTHSGGLGPRHR